MAPLTPSHRRIKYLSNRREVSLFPGAGCEQEGDNVFMSAPLSHTKWRPPLAFLDRVINYLSRPVFFHYLFNYLSRPVFFHSFYAFCVDCVFLGFPLGIFYYNRSRSGIPGSGIDVGAAGDKQLNNLQSSLFACPNQSVLAPREDLVDVCAPVQQQRDNVHVSPLCEPGACAEAAVCFHGSGTARASASATRLATPITIAVGRHLNRLKSDLHLEGV